MFDDLIEDAIWQIRNSKTSQSYRLQGHQKLIEFLSQIPKTERIFWSIRQGDSSIEQPLSRILGIERRRHPRYKTRIRVKFIGEDSYFEAHTKDVSLEGIKVNQRIPEFIGNLRFAFLFIEEQKQPPVVSGIELLENTSGSTRILLNGDLSRYQNWIQTVLVHQPNINDDEKSNGQNLLKIDLPD
jgi:hypothetical protein